MRPLDYTYLQALTPMAQHFYEIVSYPMFATLTYRRPHATLRYGEYWYHLKNSWLKTLAMTDCHDKGKLA